MQLDVHERMALLQLIPSEGDYAALKEHRIAREVLAISPDEQKFIDFKKVNEGGMTRFTWDNAKAAQAVKDVPVTGYMVSVFRVALATMNNEHRLTEQYLSVFEKFVTTYK